MKIFHAVSLMTLFLISSTANASESLSSDYTDFKNNLNEKYGIDYDITYSLLGQRTSPNGQYNAVQSYLSPSIAWTNFNNEYGTGTLNVSYSSVFYGHHDANDLQNNSGMVTPINDDDDDEQEFSGLYYTYQLPHKYNWITLGLGQYSLYSFDGTDYNNDQQTNFLNYAMSQNGSATYPDAGLGVYAQLTPGNWQFIAGFQDATNISAPSIRFNHLDDKHYTTFGQIGYNPNITGLGNGQYSMMLYNQPYVTEQPQSTTGWSINAQQNINKKMSIFGRINGVSGNIATIKRSYTIGYVINNPLDRNELDQIGLSYAYNKIDEDAVGEEIYHDYEQIIEAYWAWGISKWVTITPDFQFYINPALNKKSDYGTATSIRLTLLF